ncbi:MAG: ATP-dependent RecD-like DNA helicase [Bacillota bacterium]|nr:ATP-dependent RecD-like DNA helicase [Bacillota bacterium]
MEKKLETLTGIVKSVKYRSEDNAYTVMTVLTEAEEEVTVVGYIPSVSGGETIEAQGEYTFHKNYGSQFTAEYVDIRLPQNATGILEYLSSGAIRGIGKATAKLIVDKFGDGTLEIIENESDKLSQIKGISKAKADEIGERFREQSGIRRVIAELSELSIEPFLAIRIYKNLGPAALDFIKQNPYILCDELFDIPFEEAENIAKSLGIAQNSLCRRCAGIEYVLRHNLNNGHTFLPFDALAAVSGNLLNLSEDEMHEAVEEMIEKDILEICEIANITAVYLKRFYDCEDYIAKKLLFLASFENKDDMEQAVSQMEKELKIEYADLQRRALLKAARCGVFVLTGGPGTGKTTALNGMIRLFEKMGLVVLLAAPTGRAAKRMTEVTGHEAKTIHRLLEMEYGKDGFPIFTRDENTPLECDAVIIDEASMVDVMVFDALLHAVKAGTKLILVGDADQLPSVGAGNVLHDIIKSDLFETVCLTEIFRQAKNSLIVVNAHSINAGEYPDCNSTQSDFYFVKRQDKKDIFDAVIKLAVSSVPKKFSLDPRNDIQVISPVRKGECGTISLNHALQAALNPPSDEKKEFQFKDRLFREGDKVMQVKNNYDLPFVRTDTGETGMGIYNGDIGALTSIDLHNKKMVVDFDGRKTDYPFENLDELETAYAVTVHKSQGSEFPCVIMPAFFGPPKLCCRNLLYTAVTRAKSVMVLAGVPEAVYKMVDNNVESRRYTGLKYLLLEEAQKFDGNGMVE